MRIEKHIYTYSHYLKQKYGRRLFRVGLSTGISCPNRDNGTGCIFCVPDTFTDQYQKKSLLITEQLDWITNRMRLKCGDMGWIAYFQDNTSTYGEVNYLLSLYNEALNYNGVEELVVSTRPDCITTEILEGLSKLSKPVTLEIGMQTIHNESLHYLQRGHTQEQTDAAIALCSQYNIPVGVHVIAGIPHESVSMQLQTIEYINQHPIIREVKLHNLIAYQSTDLYKQIENVDLFTLERYIDLLCKIIPNLRGDKVVSRLYTSNLHKTQIGFPVFPGTKRSWMNQLLTVLNKKEIVQGMYTEYRYHYKE